MTDIATAIIGVKDVGGELLRKLQEEENNWNIRWRARTNGIYTDMNSEQPESPIENMESMLKGIDIVYIAITTKDDGTMARDYIKLATGKGIPVVTCEKGALGNHYGDLQAELHAGMIGYSASVGGGTMMLRYLEERRRTPIEEVYAIVNGTLNFTFDHVARGEMPGEVIKEAQRLNYAEKDAASVDEVIKNESMLDAPLKTAIVFNTLKLSQQILSGTDLKVQEMNNDTIIRLLKKAQSVRHVVSISRNRNGEVPPGGFCYEIDGWYVTGGFREMEDIPLFAKQTPRGVDNAMFISKGPFGRDGGYVVSGDGAGLGPTTDAMLSDAMRILEL